MLSAVAGVLEGGVEMHDVVFEEVGDSDWLLHSCPRWNAAVQTALSETLDEDEQVDIIVDHYEQW